MPDLFVAKHESKKEVGELKEHRAKPSADDKPGGRSEKSVKLEEEKIKKVLRRNLPRFLSSFITGPKNLRFETQDREEKIVLLLRRHPITLIPWGLLIILMIMVPYFISKVFVLTLLPANFLLISLLTWYLLTFAFAFERFLTWFFNVGILTDERVVDINFPSLLYRDISEVKTDKVQQVSTKTGGYIRSLFNFGDVLIQSAGEIPEIYFDAVPNPEQVSRIINDLMFEEEQEKLEGRIR